MESNKALAAFLIAGFAVAGAGGAYLATRSREPATEETAPGGTAVAQSDAILAPALEPRPAPSTVPPARSAASTTARARRVSPPPAAVPVASAPAPAPIVEPARQPEPVFARAPEPSAAIVAESIELEIARDSVLGLQIDSSVSSEQARVEDEVTARVTRDLRVGDRVAIPAGSRAAGEVTLVERGGRVKERARLGVRFTSVVLADGTRVPIETETIYREGDAPGGESAAKIGGGAIGGAIIGGILGGARGAAIGGSVGAGAGTAAVMAGGRNPATLPSGTPVTVRFTRAASVTVAP